jgi:hypothetical protein
MVASRRLTSPIPGRRLIPRANHRPKDPAWQSVRDVAHDRNDFLHDITAGDARSISQQILDRGADLCFGVVPIYKIPIEIV